MFMYALVIILVKLVTAVDYEGPECQTTVPCNQSEDCNKCDLTDSTINIIKTDFPGLYKTQILGNGSCRVEILKVSIYRYESNKSNCKRGGSQSGILHSQQMYICDGGEIQSSENIRDEILPKINLINYVDMVYAGCYLFVYDISYNNSKTSMISTFYFFNNNLTKEYFDNQIKNVKVTTNIIGSLNPITLNFPYRFSGEVFTVKIFNKSDYMEDIKKNCLLQYMQEGSELKCYMPQHILPGEYMLTFQAFTGWCKGTVFKTSFCNLELNFTVIKSQPNYGHTIPNEPPTLSITTIICLVGVIILVIVVTIYCLYINKNKQSDKQKQLIPNLKHPHIRPTQEREELKGIVLVYARDCEPFMDAVMQLRRLLEERCKVKVYDIFDVSLFNSEIASAPNEWAGCMLATPGVKFVLVKTPCGELLYDPIIVNYNDNQLQLEEPLLPTHTRYRRPLYADTYVHTLFRLVKDDAILPGSYRKYFVVVIPNFSGDCQFVYVNPYRRYELPSTSRHLVADLLNFTQHYDAGLPEQRLQEAIERLKQYVEQHSDYMMDLLCKE